MQKSSPFPFNDLALPDEFLNVAAICPNTRVLGPGCRFVIWVQGCCFDCPGCISPAWRSHKPANLFTVKELAHAIIQTPEIEGITLSGGEPMLQARNLHEVVLTVKTNMPVTVICYTGFTLETLRNVGDADVMALLSDIDVLIDGPYMENLNDNQGLRGSSNQRVNFLTGVYRDQDKMFLDCPRNLEAHLFRDHYLMVGIHPKYFQKSH